MLNFFKALRIFAILAGFLFVFYWTVCELAKQNRDPENVFFKLPTDEELQAIEF